MKITAKIGKARSVTHENSRNVAEMIISLEKWEELLYEL